MITRETLHDKVVRDIALRILAGEWSTLPNETNLGKELNVSRSILRQSVKVLEAKGLIEVGPTGTRVRPRADWHLLDPQLLEWQAEGGIDQCFFDNLCEIRHIIEPRAAELAALRATPQDIRELQSAFDKMVAGGDDRYGRRSKEAFIAADLQFHDSVIKASHNELLYQIGTTIRAVLRMSFSITHLTTRERFVDTRPKHKKILDAIAKGDRVAARKHMEELIVSSTARLGKALDYVERERLVIPESVVRATSSSLDRRSTPKRQRQRRMRSAIRS